MTDERRDEIEGSLSLIEWELIQACLDNEYGDLCLKRKCYKAGLSEHRWDSQIDELDVLRDKLDALLDSHDAKKETP